jgi:DNA-binding LacI/PurR family transcriptional regulator
MARSAVERAIARVEGRATDGDGEIVITPHLVTRSTTAAPRLD